MSSHGGASPGPAVGGGGGGNAASGGKGVVIISIPTASYSGNVTGSPDVTTSGDNTIVKFEGDGTWNTNT